MSAGWTPAASAISRRRAPWKPRAANSRSPASSSRFCVATALRSRRGPTAGSGAELGRSIPGLEVDHAEVLEALADARREEAEALHVRHDLREQHRPEDLHRLALERDLEAL